MSVRLPILEQANPSSVTRKGVAGYSGNVALITLGCAKNQVDSEVMLGSLMQQGFRPVSDAANADLIVVNTCAFLESAVQEGVDKILELAELKSRGRLRQLIVAGCMVERYRGELKEALPEVDRFVSTDELLFVGDISQTSEQCFNQARRPYFLYDETMPRALSEPLQSVYVKVAEGCDRPCSFCIIPRIRGKMRSRSVDSVTAEILRLSASGAKEFNLVAQDLTAYGSDLDCDNNSLLPVLLRQIDSNLTSPSWVRLLYAYPIGVNDGLVRLIKDLPNVCNYLDLPLQHISAKVLNAMRRPLGGRRTRELVERMRVLAPEIALRTTLIVGFPGETGEDFAELLRFVEEGHFTHLGVFCYSDESEAPASKLQGKVSEEVKNERRAELMLAQKQIVEAKLRGFVGQEIEVLLEGRHTESDLLLQGRSQWQAPETDGVVIINDVAEGLLGSDGELPDDSFRGRFGRVKITEHTDYDLVGTLVEVGS